MIIQHHPTEATLIAYASGALKEAPAVIVAAHAAVCPDCAGTIRMGEAVGGALFEAAEPKPVSRGALARVVARLDERPIPVAPQPRLLPGGAPRPSALRGYRLGGWRWLAPGVHRIRVLSARHPGGSLDVLRIAPGQSLPVHGHSGLEITCVLAGSFADRVSRFGPGDVAETDSIEEHQPVADRESECICLVASDGPLRMRGLLPRLLQPLIGV